MGLGNQDEIEDEMPLDPVAERLRRKMVRLLVVSVGTMIISRLKIVVGSSASAARCTRSTSRCAIGPWPRCGGRTKGLAAST